MLLQGKNTTNQFSLRRFSKSILLYVSNKANVKASSFTKSSYQDTFLYEYHTTLAPIIILLMGNFVNNFTKDNLGYFHKNMQLFSYIL